MTSRTQTGTCLVSGLSVCQLNAPVASDGHANSDEPETNRPAALEANLDSPLLLVDPGYGALLRFHGNMCLLGYSPTLSHADGALGPKN